MMYLISPIIKISCLLGAIGFGVVVMAAHGPADVQVRQQLAFLHVPTKTAFQDIQSLPDTSWQEVQELGNFGFQSDYYWIRIRLTNESHESLSRVVRFQYMAHDQVAVYQQGDDGQVQQHWLLGDMVKGVQRPIEDKHPAFPVQLHPGEKQTFYIEVQSFNALMLGVDVLELNDHSRLQQIGLILAGLIYGVLVVMALYNLGIAVFIKDKAYGIYVVYVLSFLFFVTVITGDGYYFIWQHSPVFNAYALPYASAWLMIPSLLFPYYLLNLKRHFMFAARLIRVVNIVIGIFILSIPILGLEVSITFINVVSAVLAFAVLLMGIYLTYLRVPVAGIYTLAWFILLSGLTILPLSSLGFIESNLFTRNANIIGGMIETVILSLALAQRFRQERFEKISAQRSSQQAQNEADIHRKLFEDLFTKAPLGIFQARENGEILAVNPSLVKFLGYASEEDVKNNYLDVYRRFYGAGKIGSQIFKRGEIIDFESSYRPMDSHDPIPCSVSLRADTLGSEKFVEGYIIDITERKNAQDIHSLMEHERIESINHLVSGVAHEINTPLGNNITSISHFQDLIKKMHGAMERGELSRKDFLTFISDSSELLNIMDGNLQKISGLTNRFNQLSIAKMDIEMADTSIYEHLHEILSGQFQLDGSVQYQIQCDAALRLHTYPAAWQMIIDQLVENSVTHGFSLGQTDKAIFIGLNKLADDKWQLIYSDNGQGVKSEIAQKVFEPFFTTRRTSGKNAGLGLYRVYNLVSQVLKGDVNLEEEAGFKLVIEFNASQV